MGRIERGEIIIRMLCEKKIYFYHKGKNVKHERKGVLNGVIERELRKHRVIRVGMGEVWIM